LSLLYIKFFYNANSEDEEDDDEVGEINIERLLNMFDNTEQELIEDYERNQSQRTERGLQTNE